jgi:hypothetical protein
MTTIAPRARGAHGGALYELTASDLATVRTLLIYARTKARSDAEWWGKQADEAEVDEKSHVPGFMNACRVRAKDYAWMQEQADHALAILDI